MPKNPADWLPKLFTKSEGTVREATTKKFSEFAKVNDGEGVQLVGLKGDSNIRVDVSDLTVEIPEVTTSTVMLETEDALRNSKGQFMSTEGMDALNTQKDANRFIADELAKIPSQEMQEAWDEYEEQIVTLENKVSALEGALGEHSFVFESTSNNPRDGQFILKDEASLNTNMLSSGKVIYFSNTDREGNEVSWERVAEGDVLRFSDISQQSDEIRITGQMGPSAFMYEKISGTQDRLSETPYDFIILSSFDPSGLASIDYVDEQDERKYDKTGGDISGQVRINPVGLADGQRLLTVSNSSDPKFYIYTTGQSISRYSVKSGDDGQTLTTKAYVDKKAPDYGHSRSTPVSEFLWKYMAGGASAIKSGGFGSGCFTVEFDSSDKPTCLYFSEHVGSGRYWIPGSWANYTRSIGNTIVTVQEWDGSVVLMGTTNKWHFITRREKNDGSGSAYTNDLYVTDTKPGLATHSLVDGRQYVIRGPSPFPVMGYSYDDFMNGTSASFGIEEGIEEGNEEVDKIDEGGAEQ